nr:pentapeptide repeat-containing protein [Anaerotruncus sp. DFI.9.16]
MALLIAADLRGCRLYGTNLIGADLRGADLRDADLRECVFLAQGQLGAARGNGGTLLPERLARPAGWER